MSHGITKDDSMFSVHETPWHGLGVVLNKTPQSIDEALRKAGLTWEVRAEPMFAGPVKRQVPAEGYQAIVRQDTRHVTGVVRGRYQTVQNREAFSFLEGVLGELIFVTAGSLFGGKRVWAAVRLPDFIEVGGDKVGQYGLVSTGHDGLLALTTAITPIRVVCNNTLTWALSTAPRIYKVRHIGDTTGKIHEARKVLGITVDYYKQFKKVGDKLASQKLTEKRLEQVIAELWPTPPNAGKRTISAREATRAAILGLYREGTVSGKHSTVGNAPGTVWAGVNAISEYVDHYQDTRIPDRNFTRVMDDRGGIKQRAFALLS